MTENTIFMAENKLLKRKLANEQLRLYCKYYKKNPLTAHHCDSRATSLEKLYSIDISARDRVNFFPESVYTYGNVKRSLFDDEIVLFKTDGVKILDKKKARLDDFK